MLPWRSSWGWRIRPIDRLSRERVESQLQKTGAKELHIFSLHDLRDAAIRYRIAAHMTIESFARLVHVHSRQIARYESEDYQNVSWDTLLKILERLDVKIEGKMELGREVA